MTQADFDRAAAALSAMLAEAASVTIATHINPDADTIGTGLGIYRLLKTHLRLPVEIVNLSEDLPHYLDFLPGFVNIKRCSDFDGLVIACDATDASRFGIETRGRKIVNIDHHASNSRFGDLNVVSGFASAGETAYELFRRLYPIDASAALCFYTALFSDTRYFRTDVVDTETFRRAYELVAAGAEPSVVAHHLTQRKSLASLRLLERALASLRLYRDATVAAMMLVPDDFEATGARMSDLDGIVEYGRSLATVDISMLVSALPNGIVRVSLRSKKSDVSALLEPLGGGGHRRAAGVTIEGADPQEIRDTILRNISETESES